MEYHLRNKVIDKHLQSTDYVPGTKEAEIRLPASFSREFQILRKTEYVMNDSRMGESSITKRINPEL